MKAQKLFKLYLVSQIVKIKESNQLYSLSNSTKIFQFQIYFKVKMDFTFRIEILTPKFWNQFNKGNFQI